MYIRYICTVIKNFKSYYDLCTFPLFYNKFASEKAEILFTKFAEIVVLELSSINHGGEHFFYIILAPPLLKWRRRACFPNNQFILEG